MATPSTQAKTKPMPKRAKVRAMVVRKASRPSSFLSRVNTCSGAGIKYDGKIHAAICQPAKIVRKAIA